MCRGVDLRSEVSIKVSQSSAEARISSGSVNVFVLLKDDEAENSKHTFLLKNI